FARQPDMVRVALCPLPTWPRLVCCLRTMADFLSARVLRVGDTCGRLFPTHVRLPLISLSNARLVSVGSTSIDSRETLVPYRSTAAMHGGGKDCIQQIFLIFTGFAGQTVGQPRS